MTDTILMIHGMCAGPWCWDNYKSYFESEDYNCISTTLRHHDIDPKDNPPDELGTISIIILIL